jgi:predicted nucleic acid-binding protein
MRNRPSGEDLKYIDASIPLCTITGEPREKLETCKEIMKKVEQGKERARTTAFTIAEIIHVLMREHVEPNKIMGSVKKFLDCAGLKVGDARRDLCLPALELALRYRVDFVDAHHRLTMKLHGIDEIYSLDRHFDRFPGIKRLESV